MVAISLYRGNLHRVPDVSRRWLIPRPRISLEDFRGLLRRRSKALSLLKSGTATIDIGNPPPQSLPPLPPPEDVKPRCRDLSSPGVDDREGTANLEDRKAEDVAAAAEELQLANLVSLSVVDLVSEKKNVKEEEQELEIEDDNHELGADDDKQKREKDVEEKLEILNKKKHNLVQALKQILSAEEELKRRNITQSNANVSRNAQGGEPDDHPLSRHSSG